MSIKAIVGLGNPGPRYLETRHNAGFWFVDALADRHAGSFRADARMHGELASITIEGRKIWLLKPDTFVNRSGQSVAALVRYYKIELDQLLVVYDELDLPPGVARFKSGGGHGGHNGLRDIIRHLDNGFHRLRIGIGHPGNKSEVADYVLRRPRVGEQRAIDDALDEAMRVITRFLVGDRQDAMTELHTRTATTTESIDPDR